MAGLLYIWQTCSDLISAVGVSDYLTGVVHVVILKQLLSFFFSLIFLTSCIQKCACRNECKTVCMCLYILTCTLIFNVWFYANCNSVFGTCYTNKVIVHEKGAFYMEWPNVGSQLIHYIEKVMKVVRQLFVQWIVSMGRGPINCGVLQKCSL